MKKHLTTLAAAMLLMSCGGNGSSSEAEASSPKSMEILNDINTPYSISDLPIDKTDVVAITLDNDGCARISIFGDGEKGISTDELRRMVAIEALSRNGIEAEDITEEQLKNFVSLPDIGMTEEEWAANYNKPLDELKRINAKGMEASSVSKWCAYTYIVFREEERKKEEANIPVEAEAEVEEEEIYEEEPETVDEEVFLDIEPLLWNSNEMPLDYRRLRFSFEIIADENIRYEYIDRLLTALAARYFSHFKFVTSKIDTDRYGGWNHGSRNRNYVSFEGAGHFLNSDYQYNIYPDYYMTILVDNVRDNQGNPVMDQSTGRQKLTSYVSFYDYENPTKNYSRYDFTGKFNEGLEGLLFNRNHHIIDQVGMWKEDLQQGRMTKETYDKKLKDLRKELRDGLCTYVELKFAPDATYEAFIAAMDEMYLNEILYWRVGKMTPEEMRVIKANR
jgi:lipoprotein